MLFVEDTIRALFRKYETSAKSVIRRNIQIVHNSNQINPSIQEHFKRKYELIIARIEDNQRFLNWLLSEPGSDVVEKHNVDSHNSTPALSSTTTTTSMLETELTQDEEEMFPSEFDDVLMKENNTSSDSSNDESYQSGSSYHDGSSFSYQSSTSSSSPSPKKSKSSSKRGVRWGPNTIIDKVLNLFLLVVRDWSSEGLDERVQSYNPFYASLERYYPSVEQRRDIKVICPGAGMGRLPYDISMLGFHTTLNENSLFLIVALKRIFSGGVNDLNSQTLYPFIHQTKNITDEHTQTRRILIPDIAIGRKDEPGANMSFAYGDFFDIYSPQVSPALTSLSTTTITSNNTNINANINANPNTSNKFDCICSSFFIDTVENIFTLIERFHLILNVGGLWMNNGPLHYHHDALTSFHLNSTELLDIVRSYNFEILEYKLIDCQYTKNKDSLFQAIFNCVWFIARKIK
ncbi:hypothetical protein SAMD00019534_082550 [Acytostelium subglobosum LB1]|uniref:hypothetical protein n=1 Tax=Acytostelium subglobosum LB1 TaxID=1410327 RepID=UPI000644F55C|nr:hypothetical protein SAMD00019534_082550 [Acytostelium subglobosum LB1]GAM25080.1 hypothetical protein SAMD00019534_082550 [Acytostelium subglobosum LB1]|eukprot:XP_012752169.1 hypothetical protein SAMD00019534_082550 [Acytostelium subglobosum LB1]